MRLIVDSYVAVKWAFQEEFSGQAIRLQNDNYDLFAPEVFLSEIGNVIWKKSLKYELPLDNCLKIFNSITDHFSEFVPTKNYMEKSISLAIQHQHPVYDCIYIVTALHSQIPLITADKKLFEVSRKVLPLNLLYWIGNQLPEIGVQK